MILHRRAPLTAAVLLTLLSLLSVLPVSPAFADGEGLPRHTVTSEEDPRRTAVTEEDPLRRMVATKAATAALLRVDDGTRTRTSAAGVRDLRTRRPATANGHFRIGSVTKTFVATVILQLADEGRLRLDDPVQRHLPGLVPNGDAITIRHLLNHTSGLYDYMSEEGLSTNRWRGADRFRSYGPRRLLAVALAKPPYFTTPGSSWRYSNTNYVVAGMLIEKVTGRPYGKEVERRILRPLKLTRTSVPGDAPGLPVPHARGYEALPSGKVVDATRMNPSLDWAAGEMISTTGDLNTFLTALLGGRLTSAAMLEQMRTAVDTGAGFAYGLGLQRYTLPCGRTVWGHSGELIGYLTFSFRADDGRAMTLSVNPHVRPVSTEEIFSIASGVHCQGG
ncbi:serine hydrolase domain-containing protein [Streptosporangium sp. NPDC050855]|uniref:serine hydrolase domain-containing protein n=1 Tax=Streptosporangium sp. NPDC050855 TaxID=3366194 RepID=UPI0037966F1E